jgi:hypothetical protein
MPNGPFVRSYPPPGVRATPVSYSTGMNGYFVLCLFPVVATCWFAVALCISGSKPQWMFEGLFVSIILLLLALAFLRRLKLEITVDGISFHTLFCRTQFIGFREISTAVFIEIHSALSEYLPGGSVRSWQAVITPNHEVGKPKMRIPLHLFPLAAYRELTRLLKPESGS